MLYLFLRSAVVVTLLVPFAAGAATFEFVEVQYNPDGSDDGREWVRVKNTSSEAVSIEGWKFFEGGVNHKLVAETSYVVPAGGEAVIADDAVTFRVENPGFLGNVFDSSFSLSNTGETITLKNASSTVVVTTTYSAPAPQPTAKTTTKKKTTNTAAPKEIPQIQNPEQAQTGAVLVAAPPGKGTILWPWIAGLVVLVLLAGGMLFGVPKRSGSGYEIIDEHD